jgi:hypothetical protein
MTAPRPALRLPYLLEMPHPLVTLAGLVIFGSFIYMGIASHGRPITLLPLIFFLPLWFSIRRSSIEQERRRREGELEELRHKRVLHLND